MKIAYLIGHGKSDSGDYDPGAVRGSAHEYKIAREIAKYAQEYLKDNFECDVDLYNYNGDLNLAQRIAKFKNNTYQLIIEFHLNAGKGTGCEAYYSKYSKGGLGEKVAKEICIQIAKDFGIANRGAKVKLNSYGTDWFGIVRDTTPTAILLETLFIDSNDYYKLDTADKQKKMGESVSIAVARACGLKAKTKPTYKSYTVKKGDSWWSIAEQQMGSGLKCAQLAEYNGKTILSVIHPGDVINIPT